MSSLVALSVVLGAALWPPVSLSLAGAAVESTPATARELASDPLRGEHLPARDGAPQPCPLEAEAECEDGDDEDEDGSDHALVSVLGSEREALEPAALRTSRVVPRARRLPLRTLEPETPPPRA